MIEAHRPVYEMVGHPGQRFVGSSFPGQQMALGYTHSTIAAAIQNPSQHILAQNRLAAFSYQQDSSFYGLLAKQQQHSPHAFIDQPTSTPRAPQQDHPIGYGAFGVVWYVSN